MSTESFNRSDLENILIAYGFEDAASFKIEDILTLIKELGVELPHGSSKSCPADSHSEIGNEDENSDQPKISEDIVNVAELPSLPTNEITPVVPSRDVESTNPGVNQQLTGVPGLSEEEEVKLSTFCDISSSDRDFARSILENLGWDLDSAISVFLGGGIVVPPKPSEPIPFVAPFVRSQENVDSADSDDSDDHSHNMHRNISEIMERVGRGFMPHFEGISDDNEGHDLSYGGFGSNNARDQQDQPAESQFYDDGVRVRTDPVRMQRLISRQRSDEQEHIMLGRADDPNVEWMVEPPRHLSYMGSFEHAKAKAFEEGRWLFVNIQSHEAWISNELNRTFQDETIECIFRGQYLFWQRGHTSYDGQEFMRLYKIKKEDLPLMFIIEPNTGARLKTFKEYIEPADLASALIEFYEKNSSSLQQSHHEVTLSSESAKDTATRSVESASSANQPEQSREDRIPTSIPSDTNFGFDASIFGAVPEDPVSDKDTVRVAVKLPTKRIQRKFFASDSIRSLFAFVAQQCEESRTRSFDLVLQGVPSKSLLECLDDRLEQLNGVCVNHKWL